MGQAGGSAASERREGDDCACVLFPCGGTRKCRQPNYQPTMKARLPICDHNVLTVGAAAGRSPRLLYSCCCGCRTGIQKLHIRTVPLGEQPRRIAHQPSTKTLGVVTISTPAGASPSELCWQAHPNFGLVCVSSSCLCGWVVA